MLQLAQQQSEQAIIDLVMTIIVYKFSNLSREEIQAMFGLNLEEPRAIREAEEEGERNVVLRLYIQDLNNKIKSGRNPLFMGDL